MEEKLSYHVVFTTHNSRTSQRMTMYRVEKGPAIILDLDQEIKLTSIFKDIVLKYEIELVSYNICQDHVHLIVFCSEVKLPKIVRLLKSISAKRFEGKKLWSQKYFGVDCVTFDFNSTISIEGLDWNSKHLNNAITYVQGNRIKHGLIDSQKLKDIINLFCL
jgi:REP element-mobilizing transposase RayT